MYSNSQSTHSAVLPTDKPLPACIVQAKLYSNPPCTPTVVLTHEEPIVLCLHIAGSGGQAGRTAAYSPDAFDDVPKKGKLAQRLLGGSKGVTGKLVFGSHVAGKHHKWAEPVDAAGFEGGAAGSMRAAEVQQARHSHLFMCPMHWLLCVPEKLHSGRSLVRAPR